MGYNVVLKVIDPKTKEVRGQIPVTLYCEYAWGDCFTMIENGKHYVYKVISPMSMTVEEQNTSPMPRRPL